MTFFLKANFKMQAVITTSFTKIKDMVNATIEEDTHSENCDVIDENR